MTPLNNPASALNIADGFYTGNNTLNREIVHGLGVLPKLIIIMTTAATASVGVKVYALARIIGLSASSAITAVDADTINAFHVGGAENSLNSNLFTYYWIAIG